MCVPYMQGFMLSFIYFILLHRLPAECQVKYIELDVIHTAYTQISSSLQVIGTLLMHIFHGQMVQHSLHSLSLLFDLQNYDQSIIMKTGFNPSPLNNIHNKLMTCILVMERFSTQNSHELEPLLSSGSSLPFIQGVLSSYDLATT